jgi:hypothetical protein
VSLRGAKRRGNPDRPGHWIASPAARNDEIRWLGKRTASLLSHINDTGPFIA